MPVPGDQHGCKTCLQVYNPAGFSMEFALVRSSPQRFDCVLSIVVWCGVPHHHQYLKSQPSSVGIFFARSPSVGAVSGPGLASAPLRRRRFCPRRRLSVLRFLWWPRERSRGHFLCWRGFRGGRLWLATPVAVATQVDNMLCYALFCREKKPY